MMTVITVMMTVMTVMIMLIMMIAPNLIERSFHSGALSVEKRSFSPFFDYVFRTYGPTDGRMDGRTDGWTDPLIEMRGRI